MPIFGSTFLLRIVGAIFAFVLIAVILFAITWVFYTVIRVWYNYMEKTNSEFWQWFKSKLPKRKTKRKTKK
jgi:hypothetical protein